MATRKRKKAVRKSAPRPAQARSHRQPSGPVTLEEAQHLAAAKVPSRRRALVKRRGGAGPAVIESGEAVTAGEARESFVQTQDEERRRREQEYAEVIRIMKKRGAAAAPAGGRRRALTATKTIGQPLQVFAEGDSWFDYPPFLFSGGVIPRLQKLLEVPILNMARAGDEVRFMLGVKQRKSLTEKLTDGCPAGGPWDALLFSGGGNDITDNPMVLWINDFIAGGDAKAHLNQSRFDTALSLVRIGYEDLIALRDDLSPTTALFFHSYDFAIPDGRGVCGLGPWLKPTFDLRRIVNRALAGEIVKEMLLQFDAMLTALATKHKNVHVVPTQTTLNPVKGSWHNELHPSKDGFDLIAAKFHASIKAVFPGKVF